MDKLYFLKNKYTITIYITCIILIIFFIYNVYKHDQYLNNKKLYEETCINMKENNLLKYIHELSYSEFITLKKIIKDINDERKIEKPQLTKILNKGKNGFIIGYLSGLLNGETHTTNLLSGVLWMTLNTLYISSVSYFSI